ncbi:MAG: hypothetical protein V4471_04190 [Pseudomonadota bacterium]
MLLDLKNLLTTFKKNYLNYIESPDSNISQAFQYIREAGSDREVKQGVYFSPYILSINDNDRSHSKIDAAFEYIKEIFFEYDSKKTNFFLHYLSRLDLTEKVVKDLLAGGAYSYLNILIDSCHADFLFYKDREKLVCNLKIKQLVIIYQDNIKADPVDLSIDLEWQGNKFVHQVSEHKIITYLTSKGIVPFLVFKKKFFSEYDKVEVKLTYIAKFKQIIAETPNDVIDGALLGEILAWIQKIENVKNEILITLPTDNLHFIYHMADTLHNFLKARDIDVDRKVLIKDILSAFLTDFNFLKKIAVRPIEKMQIFLLSLKSYIMYSQHDSLLELDKYYKELPVKSFSVRAVKIVQESLFRLFCISNLGYRAQSKRGVLEHSVCTNEPFLNNSLVELDEITSISGEQKESTIQGNTDTLQKSIPLYKEEQKLCEESELKIKTQTPAGFMESVAFLDGNRSVETLRDIKVEKIPTMPTPDLSLAKKKESPSKAILVSKEYVGEAEATLGRALRITLIYGINPDYNYSPRKFFEFLQETTLNIAFDKEAEVCLKEFFENFHDMNEKIISIMECYVAQHYSLAKSIDYYNDFYYFERSRGVAGNAQVFSEAKKLEELNLNKVLKDIVLLQFSLNGNVQPERLLVINKDLDSLPAFFFNKKINEETDINFNDSNFSFIQSSSNFQELLKSYFNKIMSELAFFDSNRLVTISLPRYFFDRLKLGIFLGAKTLVKLKESIYTEESEGSYEYKVMNSVAKLMKVSRFKLFFKYGIFYWSEHSKKTIFEKIEGCLISDIYREKLNQLKEVKLKLEECLKQDIQDVVESQTIAATFVKFVKMLYPLIDYPLPQHLDIYSFGKVGSLTKEERENMIGTVELFTRPFRSWQEHLLVRQKNKINTSIDELRKNKDIILYQIENLFQALKKAMYSAQETPNMHKGLVFFGEPDGADTRCVKEECLTRVFNP